MLTFQVLEAKSPTPRFVAAEELRVLQTCLQRWRTEVEADVKGKHFSLHSHSLIRIARIVAESRAFVKKLESSFLQRILHFFATELQDSINRLDEEASNIYNEEYLQQYPYKLHAVLVHEGQAASGKKFKLSFAHTTRVIRSM